MPDDVITSAPTYAERQAAILTELNAPVDQTDHAPATPEEPTTPAPSAAASTEEAAKGTGSPATKGERHAGDDPTDAPPAGEDDEKVTLTKKEIEARIAEATKRQAADQSRLAKELKAAREEAEKLKAQSEQTGFDARVLYAANQKLKELAREHGSLGYADVDDATNEALQKQSVIHQQTKAQEAEAERQRAEAQRVVDGEAANRTTFGRSLHSDTVVAIMEAAQEAGQKVTAAQAREAIKAAYGDKAVQADIADFQDLATAPAKARQRAEVAFTRITEIAVAGIVKGAVAKIEQEREANKPQARDRRQIHGETRGTGPAYSSLTPAQRRALVIAELNDDSDLRV